MDLKPGSFVADRYEIVAPIKKGGMGAVYRAMDHHFRGREVALKVMLENSSFSDNPDLFHRKFEEEANILINISHPRIPRVLDHFHSGDCHVIVMDLIEGVSLETLLEEYQVLTGKPVPEEQVVEYAIQICEILEYLHSWQPKPMIHRDIKPGNIILRKMKTEVVLVDFGLARTVNPNFLSMNTTVGTVGYAPLEQYEGQAEPRSDIYSLGVTLHHLVSGKTPIPLHIPPLQSVFPDVHPKLAAVIDKAAQEKIENRFQTASEMKQALMEIKRLLQSPRDSNALTISDVSPAGTEENLNQAGTTIQLDDSPSPFRKSPLGKAVPRASSAPYQGVLPEIEGTVPLEKGRKTTTDDSLSISGGVTLPTPSGDIVGSPGIKSRSSLVGKILIAAGIFLALLSIAGFIRNRNLYSHFMNTRQAMKEWTADRRGKVMKTQKSGLLIETGGNQNYSAILYKQRKPGNPPPANLKFKISGKKGNGRLLAFSGIYGISIADSPESGKLYTLSLVKLSLPSSGSVYPDILQTTPLPPLRTATGGEFTLFSERQDESNPGPRNAEGQTVIPDLLVEFNRIPVGEDKLFCRAVVRRGGKPVAHAESIVELPQNREPAVLLFTVQRETSTFDDRESYSISQVRYDYKSEILPDIRPFKNPPPVETPVRDLSPQKTPVRDLPPQKTPVRDLPPRETPVRDLPPQRTPVRDLPPRETPVRDLPPQRPPVRDLPSAVDTPLPGSSPTEMPLPDPDSSRQKAGSLLQKPLQRLRDRQLQDSSTHTPARYPRFPIRRPR